MKTLKHTPSLINVSNSKFCFTKEMAMQGGGKMFSCWIYDYDNIMFIRKYFSKFEGVFFDIGANIGFYTILASELSNTKVYSFEPHPVTFESLVNNISLNNRQNIYPNNYAIGLNEKVVKFKDIPNSSTNAVIDESTHKKSILVKQISLAKFIRENNILPDVIKIDVEGFETKVISGMQEFLNQVKIIIVEDNEHEILKEQLSEYFFGPLYINYGKNKITELKYYHEDPVYINKLEYNRILDILKFHRVI